MASRPRPLLAPSFLGGASSHPALVTGSETVTYGDLRERVIMRAEELGATRSLVLISIAREVEPIVTLLAALELGHPVALVDGEHANHPANSDALAESVRERYRPEVVVRRSGPEWQLEQHRERQARALHPDLALLLSTSGSTGSPKLVRLSRHNLISNADSIAEYLRLMPDDRAATTLPLQYCYGLSVLTSHLRAGASLLLTQRSVIEPQFWTEFEARAATSFAAVPHTIDLLDSITFLDRLPTTLRTVTQAGGRLAPDRVRHYARVTRASGVDFVVMYGQTEATARMAYLPPERAETAPGTIGRAIPGGELSIQNPDTSGVGELVYRGPNVMMGYAESADDLARGPQLDELRTGDLARERTDGLFEIVGRSSRFVKVFGLRVDLDAVESRLRERGADAWAVDADERLHVVEAMITGESLTLTAADVAAVAGLPAHAVRVHRVAEIPMTPSGKVNYPALRYWATHGDEAIGDGDAAGPPTAERVRDLYRVVLDRPDAGVDDSFVTLEGDSLAYVEVVVRLEGMLGAVPRDWPTLTARELAAREPARRPLLALTDTAPRRRASFARIEMPVLLRALAIVLVVGTHANLLGLQGGAHLLLGVLGYNLARFQLTSLDPGRRLRSLYGVAVAIAVPALLWIGTIGLLTGRYEPTTALLLNGALGADGAWSEQWRFWFVEAAVASILALAIIVAVPAAGRLERRQPYVVAAAVLGLALVARFLETLQITAGPTERYDVAGVTWIVVLGWLIARSDGRVRRLVSSAVILVLVPGFFGDPLREAVVIVGLLALLWVRSLLVPRFLVPVISLVATTSLFVYLVHWEVYPHWEDDVPVLATVLSFGAGIAFWAVYRASRRAARILLRRITGTTNVPTGRR